MLMFGWDSKAEIWSRFMFELVWTLVGRTQPSSPLCLWQCFYTCCQIFFLHKVGAKLSRSQIVHFVILVWNVWGPSWRKIVIVPNCHKHKQQSWGRKVRYIFQKQLNWMLFSKRSQKVEMLAGSTNEDHQVGDVLPQNLMLGTFGYFYILLFWW